MRLALELRLRVVAGQRLLRIVSPKKRGIMIMGVTLTVVAVEQVEALPVGIAGSPEVSEAPLSDRGGGVTARLERFGQRYLVRG
jgi:hypothetical protein